MNQQAQYNKGYVYFDRKDYGRAIVETRKVLTLEPEHTDALLLMGDSFYNQGQLDSALYWYEGAYSTGYRSAILCHLMAYIYDTKGKQETAINLYKEAIGQDSSIVAIYSRLGELVPGEEGNWYRTKAATMKSN
jgi:tetratricopeptide (TPR) repeat protein